MLAFICTGLMAQDEWKVEVEKVRDNIYLLKGRGGNIGLCVGEDGAFLIDDQYAPATDNILAAVKSVTDQKIKFVINTHWHGDHTGGNEAMGKADAVIFAHENVRQRMSTKQFMKAFNSEVPPSPKDALPVVTFTQDIKFHLNKETISAVHYAHAHTDGDSVIFFEKANVVHAGDIYFKGMYPFIDAGSGGTIGGMIKAVDQIIAKCDDNTIIIPGHGSLSNKKEITGYRNMMADVRDKVKELKSQGKSDLDVIAANVTAKYDEELAGGFFKPKNFISWVYETVK